MPYWYADGETCRVKLPPGTLCPLQFRPGPFQLRTLAPTPIGFNPIGASQLPRFHRKIHHVSCLDRSCRIIMERGTERERLERDFFQNALKNFGNGSMKVKFSRKETMRICLSFKKKHERICIYSFYNEDLRLSGFLFWFIFKVFCVIWKCQRRIYSFFIM